jgi:hypothetical protein
MRSQILLVLVFLLSSVAFGSDLASCRNHKAPHSPPTIVDYLAEMPADLLGWGHATEAKLWTEQERRQRITVCDEENGYLEFSSTDLDGDWKPVLALFKLKDGSPLIAQAFQNKNLGFYKKVGGSWKDVTKEVMPPISDSFVSKKISEKLGVAPGVEYTDNASESALVLELPRKGTTVRALCGLFDLKIYNQELFTLKFNDGKFVIAP